MSMRACPWCGKQIPVKGTCDCRKTIKMLSAQDAQTLATKQIVYEALERTKTAAEKRMGELVEEMKEITKP